MNNDLQQLKALAMAATPKWHQDKWGALMVSEHEPMYMRGATIAAAGSRLEQAKANTSFIAAANPATILALIARIESLAADAERYKFLRHADLDALQQTYYPGGDVPEGDEFDKIIDAAIAKEKA